MIARLQWCMIGSRLIGFAWLNSARCWFEEGGRGFALGFSLRVGFGVGFEEVGEAGFGEGFGLGFEEFVAGGGDALDALDGALVAFGFEDRGEFWEGEVVELAEFEWAEGWVLEVFEEVVGELVD
jgi:hypothetical protein